MNSSRTFFLYFMIIQVGIFVSCAHIIPPPVDQPDARQIVDRLTATGHAVSQFKGLAHIRMESGGQVAAGRIAMAAVAPDKMRVEWLNVLGQPLTSLSADGETITVVLQTEKKVYRLPQSPTGLEPVIHMPIGIEDLQQIILGSLPLRDEFFAQFYQTAEGSDLLVLKNRWHNIIASIHLDRDSLRPRSMKAYNGQGDQQYAIEWVQWRQDGRYDLPAKIVFQSGPRQRLILTMDRFWPNMDVPLSTFMLEAPTE